MPRSRRLLQAVETAVQPSDLTRHFSATLRKSHKIIILQSRLDERLLGIIIIQIQTQLARGDTQQTNTRHRMRRGQSLKEIRTLTLKFVPITFSLSGCYIESKVPASARPLYFFPITCFQMTEYWSAHASVHEFSVEHSLAGCVGRRGLSCVGAWWKSVRSIPSRSASSDGSPCPAPLGVAQSLPWSYPSAHCSTLGPLPLGAAQCPTWAYPSAHRRPPGPGYKYSAPGQSAGVVRLRLLLVLLLRRR